MGCQGRSPAAIGVISRDACSDSIAHVFYACFFLWGIVAIVRACYTMENGLNDKNGKKWEKRGKFAPIENGKKMVEKYRKKTENRANFPFFRYFSAIFSHFRSGQIFHVFPIFVVRPVFHCVAGPHDCKGIAQLSPDTLQNGGYLRDVPVWN